MPRCPHCNTSITLSSSVDSSASATKDVSVLDLFEVNELQAIQDALSDAMGVASLITTPDGVPVTESSNFRRVCEDIIRKTEIGCANCRRSDAALGRYKSGGPTIMRCMSGGLWDAGVSINAGDTHIANWLVGQVRTEENIDPNMAAYATTIGVDVDEYLEALLEVPYMSQAQFQRTADALFVVANSLSEIALQKSQQFDLIQQREQSQLALASMINSVIDVVGRVLEARDPYTAGHQRRVAQLAKAIAREMNLSQPEINEIGIAAQMHDIGKMSIPSEILSKPGKLSEIEFKLIKEHSEAGADIINSAHMPGLVADIVLQHHERCDGSGYPHGLTGDQLHLGSKVLMVADVVEAMSTHRPYRAALGIDAALDELKTHAGTKYDTYIVAMCQRVFQLRDFEFSV